MSYQVVYYRCEAAVERRRIPWLVTGDERWQKRLAPISSRVRVFYLGDFV